MRCEIEVTPGVRLSCHGSGLANATPLARIVLEAEIGPIDLGLIDAVRHDPAHRDCVLHLRKGAAGEHRDDLQRDAVAKFVEAFDQRRILQQKVLLVGA